MQKFPTFWAVLAVIPLAWWLAPQVGMGSGSGRNWEREAMLGTWTEEGGEAGNQVRLELVEIDSPASNGLVRVFEGRARFVKQFGIEEPAKATWNVENSQPLRLNILMPGRNGFLAIQMEDREHARMRLVQRIETAMEPGVLQHPEARRFRRVKD